MNTGEVIYVQFLLLREMSSISLELIVSSILFSFDGTSKQLISLFDLLQQIKMFRKTARGMRIHCLHICVLNLVSVQIIRKLWEEDASKFCHLNIIILIVSDFFPINLTYIFGLTVTIDI